MRTKKPAHCPWSAGNLSKKRSGVDLSPLNGLASELEGLGTFPRVMLKKVDINFINSPDNQIHVQTVTYRAT